MHRTWAPNEKFKTNLESKTSHARQPHEMLPPSLFDQGAGRRRECAGLRNVLGRCVGLQIAGQIPSSTACENSGSPWGQRASPASLEKAQNATTNAKKNARSSATREFKQSYDELSSLGLFTA